MIQDFVTQVEALPDSTDDYQQSSSMAFNTTAQARSKRGRKAIGLNEFKTIAAEQIDKLQARMAMIGNKQSKEWQNLRKQVLMYKLRVKQRKQALAATSQIANQTTVVQTMLEIVSSVVKPNVFCAVMSNLQQDFAVVPTLPTRPMSTFLNDK